LLFESSLYTVLSAVIWKDFFIKPLSFCLSEHTLQNLLF
jgi:hypothetical protein